MTIATALDLDQLTTQEGKDAIDRIFNSSIASNGEWLMNKEDVLIAQYGVINNIQLRDYLMGAPLTYSLDHCITALAKIVNVCHKLELVSYPFNTVSASFYYEQGNRAQALLMISEALTHNYSLALLLSRIFTFNSPATIFSAMRGDLHSKVVENLEDDASKLANEALR